MRKSPAVSKAKLLGLLTVFLAATQLGAGKLEMSDLERTPDGKFTPTFEVKDVLDSGTLLLKNNITITLVGIKRSQSPESVSFIKRLVSKRRVAFVSDKTQKGSGSYYVYLLGIENEDLPFEIGKSGPEIQGFLDLKIGFNVAKSITYNLNTILLRAGYAEVDRTYPFEHLASFEKFEEEAKQNQRGLWKSGAVSATKSDQKRFQELYDQWQAYIQRSEIKLSSRSQDYVNCEPYRGIVALGKSGLPYLIQKMEEGKRSSWNQAQFFLWHAARKMSGVDLVKEAEMISEQEAAGRYIDWWKNSPKSSSKTP